MTTTTQYDLSGGDIRVVYTTADDDHRPPGSGPPFLTYCDLTRTLTFSVDEVATVETEAGHMLTIDLPYVPGGEDLSFSLLIPHIYRSGWSAGAILVDAVGITSVHGGREAGPCFTFPLSGTACVSTVSADDDATAQVSDFLALDGRVWCRGAVPESRRRLRKLGEPNLDIQRRRY